MGALWKVGRPGPGAGLLPVLQVSGFGDTGQGCKKLSFDGLWVEQIRSCKALPK